MAKRGELWRGVSTQSASLRMTRTGRKIGDTTPPPTYVGPPPLARGGKGIALTTRLRAFLGSLCEGSWRGATEGECRLGGGVLERSLPPPRASRGPPPSSEGGKGIVPTMRLCVINRGCPYGDQTKRHCRGDHWSPVGGTTPFAQASRRRSHAIVGVVEAPTPTTK